MKKKLTAIALVVALLAVAVIGGTLAYFTDTDNADNVFTTGKVDITLVENFDEENAKLLPGSQTKNAVQKEVSIKLEDGSEDSYVWYEWLIPSALDSTDGSTGTNNIIHVNSYGATWDKYRESYAGEDGALPIEKTWDHDPEVELGIADGPQGYFRTEVIDGVKYNVYVVLYHGKLSAGEETTKAMSQVYMDPKVDTNAKGEYIIDGVVIDHDFSKGVHIIVRAYGIQADGFANVYEAYKAYNS